MEKMMLLKNVLVFVHNVVYEWGRLWYLKCSRKWKWCRRKLN